MEGVLISGVALDNDEAKVTLDRVPDQPGVAATVFQAIAAEGISVDMIVQNVSHDGATDLSFTAPLADIPRLRSVMERVVKEIDAHTLLDRRPDREGVARRRGHEGPSGRGGGHVRRAGGGGHQHRDDLHLADPHLVRDPTGRRRARRAHDPRAVRAGSRRGAADRRAREPPRHLPRYPTRRRIPPPPGQEAPATSGVGPDRPSRAPLVVGLLLAVAVFGVGAIVLDLGQRARSICEDANVSSERFGYCITAPAGWRLAEATGRTSRRPAVPARKATRPS